MTKRELKLLSRWPEHQRRGKVVFVLLQGIVPPFLGILAGVLAYAAVSPRHVVYWGGAAFMLTVVAVAGGIRGALVWDRTAAAYAGAQHAQS